MDVDVGETGGSGVGCGWIRLSGRVSGQEGPLGVGGGVGEFSRGRTSTCLCAPGYLETRVHVHVRNECWPAGPCRNRSSMGEPWAFVQSTDRIEDLWSRSGRSRQQADGTCLGSRP